MRSQQTRKPASAVAAAAAVRVALVRGAGRASEPPHVIAIYRLADRLGCSWSKSAISFEHKQLKTSKDGKLAKLKFNPTQTITRSLNLKSNQITKFVKKEDISCTIKHLIQYIMSKFLTKIIKKLLCKSVFTVIT